VSQFHYVWKVAVMHESKIYLQYREIYYWYTCRW